MSDPVKSSDIEDVLSSIRRLVSEDSKRAPATDMVASDIPAPGSESMDIPDQPEPTASATEEAVAEHALVLTPALRVHDGGKSATDTSGDAPVPPQSEPVLQEPVVLEPVAPNSGEHAGEDVPASEPPDVAEAEDAVLDAVADAIVAGALEDDDAPAPDPDTAKTADGEQPSAINAPDEGGTPPDEAAETEADSLEAKIAALETLIGKKPEEWEPEEGDASPSDDAGTQNGAAETLDWEDHEPAADDAATGSDGFMSEAPDLPEVAPEVEATEGPRVSQIATETAAVTGAEPEHVTPAADADMSDDPVDGPLLTDEPEGLLIDEATLRDMVCDIVREELQGALGERITRNVRRLVRREIHRALASQELD